MKLTILLVSIGSKLVPVMVTIAPIGPLGVKAVIAGGTIKFVALVAVFPATSTVIFPDVAPDGTVVVMPVAVLAVTVVSVPLNLTVLAEGVVLKLVPVMITVVPTNPEVGVKPVIVGVVAVLTVNGVALVAVLPDTVTVIGPVVAPVGTVVVILVAVLAVTTASVPLN